MIFSFSPSPFSFYLSPSFSSFLTRCLDFIVNQTLTVLNQQAVFSTIRQFPLLRRLSARAANCSEDDRADRQTTSRPIPFPTAGACVRRGRPRPRPLTNPASRSRGELSLSGSSIGRVSDLKRLLLCLEYAVYTGRPNNIHLSSFLIFSFLSPSGIML